MNTKWKFGLVPTLGLCALLASQTALADPCVVIEDASGDSASPAPFHDFTSIGMFTEDDKLGVTITLAGLSPNLLADYGVDFVGHGGKQWFLTAQYINDIIQPPLEDGLVPLRDAVGFGLTTYYYGEIDDTTGGVSILGPIEGSTDGNSITMMVPLGNLGLPTTLSAIEASAGGFLGVPGVGTLTLTAFDTTEAPGEYAVGTSCSAKIKGELSTQDADGVAPLQTSFDASLSTGDQIASYLFDFGDGSAVVASDSPYVTHVYANAGDYTATVTPVNKAGEHGQAAVSQVRVSSVNGASAGSLGAGLLLALGLLGFTRRR